jgi:selenide,water dikinase
MAASSKRARVMARSQKLGHCICDPRKPCPCDLLVEQDLCSCAGERPGGAGRVGDAPQLTRLVKNAGCASKIPPADLARVLSRLPAVSDPRLLVGSATADDAGVFRISPDLCLVQTVDVFTPSVDDPYTFGRIAACNSLSDVYAMGGRPVTALSIIAYPIQSLGDEWMYQVLKGGADQLAEAGVVLTGGHSINDEEIKYGFAITGVVAPDAIITNAGAQPGDVLILTKPLGTGIISFAAQIGRASPEAQQAAAASMTMLNREASEIMVRHGAHACTDVTGFGLLGHLLHIARESGVTAEMWPKSLPLLPEVLDYARQGMVSGAAERNREYVSGILSVSELVPEHVMDILLDPQTSGGLLLSVSAEAAEGCLADLRAAGCEASAIIGRVTGRSPGRIVVTDEARAAQMRSSALPPAASPAEACCAAAPVDAACCDDAPVGPLGAGSSAQQAFQRFMTAAFTPGALDVVQKELITIALSVATLCEPCLKTHLAKASSMGITPQEIEEAAWLGVAFGGARAMMFWQASGTKSAPAESK